MNRRTLWKSATGVVAASLMLASLASAVHIEGLPHGWKGPFCPYHPRVRNRVLTVVGCESGVLWVPAGVTEFVAVIASFNEVLPSGCPKDDFSGVASANIYRTHPGGRRTLAAAVRGRFYSPRIRPGESQSFRIKWLHGTSRSGDEGILKFEGLNCRIQVP